MKAFDDNFDFTVINNFEGYVTSKDKTNVAPNVLVRGSKNVYKKDTGTISIRDGLKRYGEADSTFQGIVSAYEWDTSLGFQRALRVLGETSDGAADGKLQVMSTAVDGVTPIWYDLESALTLTRYVLDSYWNATEVKDSLLMVRGDDNIYKWSGGLAVVAAQAAAGSTLTLEDATSTWVLNGFSGTAGQLKFKINGSATEYEYTGGQGTATLTGITPALPAITADTVILQSIITSTDEPAANFINDFIKVIGNQLYCGSYTSRLVYVSANDDFTDFSVPAARVAGEPFLLTLDENPTGITVRQGNAHIPAGLFSWYVISFQEIAVGTDLVESVNVDKQEVAAQTTALAHEFIDTVGDDIIYLDQEGQVRIYGIFRNIIQAKYPSISQQIRQELQGVDFSGGALRAIGDFVYVTAPISGVVYLHETREAIDGNGNVIAERLWHPPQTWQTARVALINGVEYAHSSVNPQLYQMWDTEQWHDDSPSDEPLAYTATAAFSYQQADGRRQGMTALSKVYFEGYMTQGTELLGLVLSDYQGANGAAGIVVNSVESPADFFTGAFSPSLGDSSLGENPLGMGLSEEEESQENLPKFRTINDTGVVNCFEFQVVVYSQEPGSRWEILAWGTNAGITLNQQATFLRK